MLKDTVAIMTGASSKIYQSAGSAAGTNFSRTAKRTETAAFSAYEKCEIGYSLIPDEVASVIIAMLEQPPQAWMSEVVLRPLKMDLRRIIN